MLKGCRVLLLLLLNCTAGYSILNFKFPQGKKPQHDFCLVFLVFVIFLTFYFILEYSWLTML